MKITQKEVLRIMVVILFTSATYAQKDWKVKRINLEDLLPAKTLVNPFCNSRNVHANFKDIIGHLNKDDVKDRFEYRVAVEATSISPGRPPSSNFTSPTHYFTSWGVGNLTRGGGLCSITTGVMNKLYSDRNYFKGQQDRVHYLFDPIQNSVTITLKSWGNGQKVLKDLKRQGNVIYHSDSDGSMTIFSIYLLKTIRIL